jgi:ABC-type spermidine/putrescine transport system permease subunit II
MLSRRLECYLEGWSTFDRVGIPLNRVGLLSTGLECCLQSWNDFYRDGMLSTGLECHPEGWNSIVQGWNAF